MNNEPVAWMLADKEAEHIRSIMAVQHDFVPEGCVEIPLYTHPVKDKPHPKCDEACMYLCQMRELTDEEIGDIWASMLTDTREEIIEFARAILRKASEK
jgi:hypothetical protein